MTREQPYFEGVVKQQRINIRLFAEPVMSHEIKIRAALGG
jgi:hypothetical protein